MYVNEAKRSGPLYESLTLIFLFIVLLLLHELFQSAKFSLAVFNLLSAEIDKKHQKILQFTSSSSIRIRKRYEEGKKLAAVGFEPTPSK